jgi:predicted anti-sigma-YlaC factor YlaD
MRGNNDSVDMARHEPFSPSDCEQIRQRLSDEVDGEWHSTTNMQDSEADPNAELQAHLAGCSGCRDWQQLLFSTTRHFRVHETASVPDLSGLITAKLVTLHRKSAETQRASPFAMLRLALGTISIGLIVGALTNLAHAPDSFGSGHLPRELGGFELALGVGFLFAALRPRHAPGVAIVGAVVGSLLGLTALWDVLAGNTTSGIEAHHPLDLAGAAAAVAVARLGAGTASTQEFGTLRTPMGMTTSAT